VGLGGTGRANSSTETAVRLALRHAQAEGAETLMLGAEALDLPMYSPASTKRTGASAQLVDALRRCDGLIVGSPGYHGGISGMVKNALDYTEDLRGDRRVYLAGRAVGCVVTAAGYQGAVTTLSSLRSVVHALRGWPTPLGVVINTSEPAFTPHGEPRATELDQQLRVLAREVLEFATRFRREV
jgi:FMN reductase